MQHVNGFCEKVKSYVCNVTVRLSKLVTVRKRLHLATFEQILEY